MLRTFFALLLVTACSFGTKSSGGKHPYRYDPGVDYGIEDLKVLSPAIVKTEQRDPPVGKLDRLFDRNFPDLKRIGIVVFETEIQPTRSGLSDKDLVYVSEQGKQLVTERLLSVWEEGMSLVAPDFDFVSTEALRNSKVLTKYGLEVPDYIKADRTKIEADDFLWLSSGKKTSMQTMMNPRGLRDLSFLLVPASELMGGPKWSEQNKIFLNDLCKELKLDAVFVILSQVSWTAARKDKFTNENLPEEINLRIKATTLVPFGNYHDRLKELNERDHPVINVAYRFHDGKVSVPVTINIPDTKKNFSEIETRILNPLFRSYRDLSLMMLDQMARELRKTH